MICRIRGNFVKKDETHVVVDVGGIFYEILISPIVIGRLKCEPGEIIELVIYHYFTMEKTRSIPMLIGFIDELEKDFFEKFISVSGIGPRAALKAFDKPISHIASAIEEGDDAFLKTLAGIGNQKAKQIVASLQGKVGRFVLMKSEEITTETPRKKIIEEAKQILKRLQYSSHEIDDMVNKVLGVNSEIDTVEEFLNEIYRQKR